MIPPRFFRTHRLLLRPLGLRDASRIFKLYAQDPVVTRYLAWKPHRSVRETRTFLRQVRTWRRDGTEHIWAITLGGRLVGSIGLRPKRTAIEIGYVLARRYWGRGFMPEAAGAVVAWAFSQPRVRRVWATCDIDNRASARVLEKLGMRQERVRRKYIVRPNLGDGPRDTRVFSMTRAMRRPA